VLLRDGPAVENAGTEPRSPQAWRCSAWSNIPDAVRERAARTRNEMHPGAALRPRRRVVDWEHISCRALTLQRLERDDDDAEVRKLAPAEAESSAIAEQPSSQVSAKIEVG
jgi:hypothetical protein